MKYLSVLVFAVLLSSTWFLINSEAAVPLETHIGIQARLSQILVEAIQAKKPNSKDIEVTQIWTEPYGSGKPIRVKAHFSYRYSENSTENGDISSVIEGEGILEKQNDDGSGLDRWALSDVKTNNDSLNFEQALVITTGDNQPADTPNETH